MSENLPFIPRQMDDAGLTPAQFRIVCRVSRRGVCNESIASIAKGCRLDRKTVKTALPLLVLRCVLAKEKRPGQTSIYTVKPPATWQIEPSPNATPAQMTTQVAKRTTTKPKSPPDHLAQMPPHKGSPSEGNPIKGGEKTPPGLEKMQSWQLRKDLRESNDPAERKAIRAEMQRRKGVSIAPGSGWGEPFKPTAPAPAQSEKPTIKPFMPSPQLAAKFRAEVEAAIKP